MLKSCVITPDGGLQIGEWDYQYYQHEVEPEEKDEEGNVIKKAVYETRAGNPMPEGSIIEEREVVEGPDGGLYLADYTPPKTSLEVLQETVDQLVLDALMGGA